MFRHEHGLVLPDQSRQLPEMVLVEGICRAEGESHTVQAQWVVPPQPLEISTLRPASREIVFGMSLEPANRRPVSHQVSVMLGAKTDTGSQRNIRCDRV